MFSVKITPLMEECQRIERQIYEISNQIFELENLIKELTSLSNLEGCIAGLRIQLRRMKTEREKLLQMVQALNDVVLYWNSCESRVCDNAEHEIIFT